MLKFDVKLPSTISGMHVSKNFAYSGFIRLYAQSIIAQSVSLNNCVYVHCITSQGSLLWCTVVTQAMVT